MNIIQTRELKQISGGGKSVMTEFFFSLSCGYAVKQLSLSMLKDNPVLTNHTFVIPHTAFLLGLSAGEVVYGVCSRLVETYVPSEVSS